MTWKTNNWIFLLITIGVLSVFVSNCKKDTDDDDNNKSTVTVTDIDGNVYHTVGIGTQVWMVENLKTTRYRNGNSIPLVTDEAQWANLTAAYCNYDNDMNIANTYGRLYNWYAVSDSRNIAPVGWHVPSAVEWKTLVDYFGGADVAANMLKEQGATHWQSPNTGATGESGFLALPGGYCRPDGIFRHLGNDGIWWTSIEHNTTEAWARCMFYCYETVNYTSSGKSFGFSVRCIKDNE